MTQVDMDACMKAGMPGEQHKLIDAFAGTWKAKVRMWMDPTGKPMESTGVMVNTWTLGGRFIRHDYQGDEGQFQGEGYFGFNNVTGKYEGVWLDGMSTSMSTDAGDYDEAKKAWNMAGEGELPGGTKFVRRSLVTIKGPDSHTMEMFMTGPDGNEVRVMDIEYARS